MSDRKKSIPPARRARSLSKLYNRVGEDAGFAEGLAEVFRDAGDPDHKSLKAISRALSKQAERLQALARGEQ